MESKEAVDGVIENLVNSTIVAKPGYRFVGWQKTLGTVPKELQDMVAANPKYQYLADAYAKVTATYTAQWEVNTTGELTYNDIKVFWNTTESNSEIQVTSIKDFNVLSSDFTYLSLVTAAIEASVVAKNTFLIIFFLLKFINFLFIVCIP